MQVLISQLVNGLSTGGIYALIVLGMNLLMLVRNIVHHGFSHICVLNMAVGWLVYGHTQNVLISFLAMFVCGVVATVCTEPLFRPLSVRGAELETILAEVRDWVAHARPMFVPLELKFVKKSGRVSAAAAFVGDALGMKPLITFENGESKVLTKARGENKAIAALVETCLNERKAGSEYALVYGSNPEAFEKLKEAWSEVMDMPPIAEYPVGNVISINTGPNIIGIIYRT